MQCAIWIGLCSFWDCMFLFITYWRVFASCHYSPCNMIFKVRFNWREVKKECMLEQEQFSCMFSSQSALHRMFVCKKWICNYFFNVVSLAWYFSIFLCCLFSIFLLLIVFQEAQKVLKRVCLALQGVLAAYLILFQNVQVTWREE